eukprot:366156-Chlamydomonas_euryale.AAC.5
MPWRRGPDRTARRVRRCRLQRSSCRLPGAEVSARQRRSGTRCQNQTPRVRGAARQAQRAARSHERRAEPDNGRSALLRVAPWTPSRRPCAPGRAYRKQEKADERCARHTPTQVSSPLPAPRRSSFSLPPPPGPAPLPPPRLHQAPFNLVVAAGHGSSDGFTCDVSVTLPPPCRRRTSRQLLGWSPAPAGGAGGGSDRGGRRPNAGGGGGGNSGSGGDGGKGQPEEEPKPSGSGAAAAGPLGAVLKGWEERVAYDPEFPVKMFIEQVGEDAVHAVHHALPAMHGAHASMHAMRAVRPALHAWRAWRQRDVTCRVAGSWQWDGGT